MLADRRHPKMRVRFCLLAVALHVATASAQGTFTYTFLQDTSPLQLGATFQASQEAVQTGFLTMNLSSQGRILTDQPHYVLYQGVQCPITGISFPVDPMNGAPTLVSGASLTDVAASAPNGDEIDIGDAIAGRPADISIWRGGEPIAHYINSFGQWSVSYVIPEPRATKLLLCGLAALALSRRRDGPKSNSGTLNGNKAP
jgi:hypothetical protein